MNKHRSYILSLATTSLSVITLIVLVFGTILKSVPILITALIALIMLFPLIYILFNTYVLMSYGKITFRWPFCKKEMSNESIVLVVSKTAFQHKYGSVICKKPKKIEDFCIAYIINSTSEDSVLLNKRFAYNLDNILMVKTAAENKYLMSSRLTNNLLDDIKKHNISLCISRENYQSFMELCNTRKGKMQTKQFDKFYIISLR